MEFLKNLWRKKIKVGSFFGSTPNELSKFLCGIGESEIKEKSIKIWKYPFESASIYPAKEIQYDEINEIHLEEYPPTIMINSSELIFISRESVDKLTEFANRNQIKLSKRIANWSWITEPFLDTEFDDKQKEATSRLLIKNGFSGDEVTALRKEIGEQMYKYNFDTMLWEWRILSLNDVLSAMRPKLKKEEFKDFYWRAMEIEQRKLNG